MDIFIQALDRGKVGEKWDIMKKDKLIGISRKIVKKHYKIFANNFSEKRLTRLGAIQVGRSKRELIIQYWAVRLLVTTGVILGIILGLLLWVLGNIMSDQKKLQSLPRDSPGGGKITSQVLVEAGDSRKLKEIVVDPRELTKQELQEEFSRGEKYVSKVILGKNKTLDKISQNLVLPQEIPDSPLSLSWELDSSGFIQKDGRILWNEIKKKTTLEIFLTMSYGEEQKTVAFEMTLVPQKRGVWKQFWQHWQEALAEKNREMKHNKRLQLPNEVDGLTIKYQKPQDDSWKYLLALGVLLFIMIPFLLDQKQEQEIAKRKEQLQMAYPEFIEQFILLMGAGLTLRGAWVRICEKYLQKKSGNEQAFHYLYEEMVVTMREMDNGLGEQKAYEMFGKRTEMLPYMKFSSLIVQNLKKGSADLLGLLEYEAVDAFARRKENAKALGEKAGTKLLMPMMLMLLIVFIIILYSAFQSM